MHTIRLRGPWKLSVVHRYIREADGTWRANHDELPSPAKMTMPADWSAAFGADFLGRVAYHRVFHWTAPLYDFERVFLVVEAARSSATVTLNSKLVGAMERGDPACRFDISDWLEKDNTLEVIVDHPDIARIDDESEPRTIKETELVLPGGLIGEVRLEIEE